MGEDKISKDRELFQDLIRKVRKMFVVPGDRDFSVYWAQMSRFHLNKGTESSLRIVRKETRREL
jgi:hypothetical protein